MPENFKTKSEQIKDQFSIEEIKQQIAEFNVVKEPPKEKSKILYVDDEPNALISFKASFRRSFEVYIANSADEARAIVDDVPDLQVIVTDQRMPEELGTELLASILKTHPDPIRILLTGYSDIDAVIDAINKGNIYRYVNKPYITDEFQKILENATEVFELRKAKEELTKVVIRANKQLEFLLRQQLLD